MNLCPDCDYPIPDDAPLGLCPACLVSMAGDEELDESPPSDHRMIGDYRVIRQIGEGGFAIVYEAEQIERVNRRVALKLLKPKATSPQILARFDAERQALALMDHPNIASIYDAGETAEGDPYFVMELVDGEAINAFSARRNLSFRDRVAILRNVCEAVQHAHLKGVLHRDIKPSNVIVTEIDRRPVPKVIDFGIARALDVSLTDKVLFTEFHQIVGTPSYMSPEQAALDGLPLDGRSDIYSLGVLIYETLSGTRPFPEEEENSIPDLLRRVIHEEPPPLSRHNRALRGEIEWVVSKAIAKNPEDRYDSAGALARELDRVLENRPVEAAAPSNWYRVSKFIRRHRGSVVAGSLAVVALLAGTTVSIVQNLRATRLSESLQIREVELRNEFRNSDFRMGLQLAARRRPGDAIAHFCRALRTDPEHHASASCLLALLMNQKFNKLVYPAIDYPDSIDSCRLPLVFEGNERVISLVDGPERLAAWEPETGHFESFPTGLETPIRSMISLGASSHFAMAAGKIVEIRSSAEPGKSIYRFDLSSTVSSLTSSSVSGALIGGCEDGSVHVWHVETGKPVATQKVSDSEVSALAVGREGRFIGFGTSDGEVGVWVVGQEEKWIDSQTHRDSITAVAISKSGTHLATGDENGVGHIWRSPRMIPLAGPLYHGGALRVLSVSSANRKLMTGSDDGYARLWKMNDGAFVPPAQSHRSPVTFGTRTNSAGDFITGGGGGTVRVWSASDGSGESLPGAAHSTSLAVSSNLQFLVSVSDVRRRLGLYEINREPVWLRRLNPGDGIDHRPIFGDPCPKEIVTDSGKVRVEHPSNHFLHRPVPNSEGISMRAAGTIVSWALRSDGKQVAALIEGERIQLWDPQTGEELAPPIKQTRADIFGIRFPEERGQLELLLEDGELARLDIPPPEPHLPAWFLDFAERLGGKHLAENGEIRNLNQPSLDTVLKNIPDERLAPNHETDIAWRFVRWFSAERAKRPLGPSQNVVAEDYVNQLLDTGKPKYLFEALRLDPSNPHGIEMIMRRAEQ